jgi:DNA-directed RNA polymerase specialized sigma24 family protein
MRRLGAGEEIENIPAYAFGVARLLWLEWARAPEQRRADFETLSPLPAPSIDTDDETERRRTCLERCLQELPAENRALLLEYYRDERRAKIDLRQALAERLGLRRNALTKRIIRLRARLETCVTGCAKS